MPLIHGYIFINIIKVPRNKHERNWERVAVAFFMQWWLLKESFFQAINFCFTRTKCLQPVTATHIFPPHVIKYHKVRQPFRCFLLPSWQIRWLSYQAPLLREVFSLLQVSRHIYTSGIPEELSVYAHTMSRSPKHFFVCFFQCRRNFNFMACFKVIILKTRIKRAF